MKRVSILGVIVGGAADCVASGILALPIVFIALTQVPPQQISAWLHGHPAYYLAAMVLGFIASVFGGYIAALIARRAPVLNGALAAWYCVGTGAYGLIRGETNAVEIVLLMPVSVAATALGGRLRLIQTNRRIARAQPGI